MVGKVRKGTAVCGLVGRGKAVKARLGWAWLGKAGRGMAWQSRQGEARLGSARHGSLGGARQGLAGPGMAGHGSQVPVRYVMDWLGAFCRGAVWQLRQGAIKKKEVTKNGCI